jgi:CDP-glucose 4,6-dehydratase
MVGDELKKLNGPIFITGHTGFKGSWLSLLLKQLKIEHFGYSLEAEEHSLYRRANLERASSGVVGDIRDLENLSKVIKDVRPSVVIHLAAQSLVLKSFQEPLETFETNCMGTANTLKAAFATPSVKAVLVITTDKVYQNNNSGKRFVESDPLEGKDPYSASKVAAEAVCAAWQQISKISGGPKVIVARAGNVIGGGDFAKDRLIPDVIRAITSGKTLQVRSPLATRPWQHVLDPLLGYLKYLEMSLMVSLPPNALNFGPTESSLTVAQVIDVASNLFKEKLFFEIHNLPSQTESQNLDLDSSQSNKILDWKPRWNQEDAIKRTFEWWQSALSGTSSAIEECEKDIKYSMSPS